MTKPRGPWIIAPMFSLIPKETAFFDLFARAAANVHAGSLALLEYLEKFDNRIERAKKIKDIEHAGDEITHETLEKLNTTFITPLDREDIHELICRLDDIVDLVDTAVIRMELYKIQSVKEDAKLIAHSLVHATGLIQECLPVLQDAKKIDFVRQKGREIHAQENEADRILQHGLAKLFETGADPIEVIKWKDILEKLETATDRCEDVANIIEGILLKNA